MKQRVKLQSNSLVSEVRCTLTSKTIMKTIRRQKDLKHDENENSLFNSQQKYRKMKIIRSDHHQISSY